MEKQWEIERRLPKSAIKAFQHCTDFLPNKKKLFATLPVTSVTSERIFSVLKRLKMYLKATVTKKKLNRFTLATIT